MVIDDMDRILEYIYNRIPNRHPAFQISRDVFLDDHIRPVLLLTGYLRLQPVHLPQSGFFQP
jgi:hypothetical protein